MAVTVEPFADEPIVVFTFRSELDEESVAEADSKASLLVQQLGAFYAVVDLHALHNHVDETWTGFKDIEKALNYPGIHVIFVAPNKVHAATHFPTFDNLDAALDHARKQIAMSNSGRTIS